MTANARKVGAKRAPVANGQKPLSLLDRLRLASDALVSVKTVDKWYANATAVNEGNRARLERAAAKFGIERKATV
jgi:hypothetical protein